MSGLRRVQDRTAVTCRACGAAFPVLPVSSPARRTNRGRIGWNTHMTRILTPTPSRQARRIVGKQLLRAASRSARRLSSVRRSSLF
jgi:hypothetical protein